jgi:hypothetical protein
MGAIVSLRVTREERRQLERLRQRRGCRSLSDTMRLQIGFPLECAESLDGADDIAGVERLAHATLRMIDRLDDANKLTYKIAQHLGIPMVRHKSMDQLMAPLVELEQPAPLHEDGRKRVHLPPGFSRGRANPNYAVPCISHVLSRSVCPPHRPTSRWSVT